MELWIARDEFGFLGLYKRKPVYKESRFQASDWYGEFMGLLYENDFPEVTFENSPQKVKIELI